MTCFNIQQLISCKLFSLALSFSYLELHNFGCSFPQSAYESSSPVILVINKIDCVPNASSKWVNNSGYTFVKCIFTCAVTGQGIQDLETAILEIIGLDRIPRGGRKWAVNQVNF